MSRVLPGSIWDLIRGVARRRTSRYSTTIMSVTDRACARSAPAMIVADLKRYTKNVLHDRQFEEGGTACAGFYGK